MAVLTEFTTPGALRLTMRQPRRESSKGWLPHHRPSLSLPNDPSPIHVTSSFSIVLSAMLLMNQHKGTESSPANVSSESSMSLQTSFSVSSEMGVELRVWLSDMIFHDETRTAVSHLDERNPPGHHFLLNGTIVSQDRTTLYLDHHPMCAISSAMLEDINSLRDGWLSISNVHARSCIDKELNGDSGSHFPHAVTVTLVPCNLLDRQRADRRIRVVLQWIDLRAERAKPLIALFCQKPMPNQLRDLVRQMSSRLLIEALLKSPSSAQLFHRSWQQRRREVGPLIGSIATSMRSLLSNAGHVSNLAPLLQQLDLDLPLPSVITIGNLLTRFDLAAFPPATPPLVPACPAAPSIDLTIKAEELEKLFGTPSDDDDDDVILMTDLGQSRTEHSATNKRNIESGDTALHLFCLTDDEEDEEDLMWLASQRGGAWHLTPKGSDEECSGGALDMPEACFGHDCVDS